MKTEAEGVAEAVAVAVDEADTGAVATDRLTPANSLDITWSGPTPLVWVLVRCARHEPDLTILDVLARTREPMPIIA